MKLMFLLSLIFLASINASAIDKIVDSISEGSCWLDLDEGRNIVKVASFNDAKSYNIDSLFMDKVSSNLRVLLESDEFLPTKLKLSVHCGAYGSSVVLNFVHENKRYCSWVNPSADQIKIRSFGETNSSDTQSCDGFKVGEYLIALSSDRSLQDEFLSFLTEVKYSGLIKSYEVISSKYIKIEVEEELSEKEAELIRGIKNHHSVKRVERNNFYHPVGEFKFLNIFSIE